MHALFLESFQCGLEIVAGLLAKLHETDIADLVFAERKFFFSVNDYYNETIFIRILFIK